MRRSFRRAGWALAAAGGLGLSGPALAQSNTVHFIGPAGHASTVEPPSVLNDGQARYEESQVELAWLAEPMLFSLNLGAQLKDNTLIVRGYVPTAAVHDQALKVAREQTTFRVLDDLKIYPQLATRGSSDKPETIQHYARQLLVEQFPEHGKNMEVKCDPRGRVTVTGPIGSYEEKLLVSRKLRQVEGCNCVVNQLLVTVVMKDGHARALVTADGKMSVSEEKASDVPGEPARLEMPKKIVVEAKPTVLTRESPSATGIVKSPAAVVIPPRSNDTIDLLPAPRNTIEIAKPQSGNTAPKSDIPTPPPLPKVPTPTEWTRPAQPSVPAPGSTEAPKRTVPTPPPLKDVPPTALPPIGETKKPVVPPVAVPDLAPPALTFPKTTPPGKSLPDVQSIPSKTEKAPDVTKLPVIENGVKEPSRVIPPSKPVSSLDLPPIQRATPAIMPPLKDNTVPPLKDNMMLPSKDDTIPRLKDNPVMPPKVNPVPALPDARVPPTTSKGASPAPSYTVGTISFADEPSPIKPVQYVSPATEPKLPPTPKIPAPPTTGTMTIKPVEMKVPTPDPKTIVPPTIAPKLPPESKVPVPPTTGTMTIKPVEMKVPTPEPKPVVPAPVLATPAEIRSQILKVCGTAREVEVIPLYSKGIKIRYRASNDEEATKICDKINALPELVPYDVKFDVRVTPGS